MSAATKSLSVLETASEAFASLVEGVARSAVEVASGRWKSSGFVIGAGRVVASEEAVDEDGVRLRFLGGAEAAAEIAGRDPSTGIVLLRAPDAGGDAAVKFRAGPVRAGETIAAIGLRSGGVVAAAGRVGFAGPAWRSMRGGSLDQRIELDVAVRRGMEGAVIVDAAGEAVGMLALGPRGLPLAIPAPTIVRIAPILDARGEIPRGYLGVAVQQVRTSEGQGLIVMSVDGDSPAAKAGVLQGDVVMLIDGEPIHRVRSLLHALGPDSVGKNLRLSLRRGGAAIEVAAEIAERPKR